MSNFAIKKAINVSAYSLSFFATLYILLFVNEKGFEFLCLLPLTFGVCYYLLSKTFKNSTLILFYACFTGVSFLRYVVGPFLLCFTNDYYGRLMHAHPSISSLHIATYLMIYELIVCSSVVYFLSKKVAVIRNSSENLILPKSYFVYTTFVILTCLLVFFNPQVLFFFSFAVWGMNRIDISQLSPIAQVTIMLAISAKFILFWVLLSIVKAKYDKSKSGFWAIGGFIITLIFGFIYYGGNRAQFLFSLITSLYLFSLFFPKLKNFVIVLSIIAGIVVLSFITDQRKYTDTYFYEKGIKNKVLNISQTITAYFGGLTNVAFGVEMAEQYTDRNKVEQLAKDVILPIVGLNKIIRFEDREISNTLFNYVFFQSKKNISQILPSIAHGYYLGGLVLCVVIDIIQLLFVFFLVFLLKKTRRMELVFLFNIVLFRFSLMFGQNISQQINGIAMQLVIPICVFWLNNHILLTKKN